VEKEKKKILERNKKKKKVVRGFSISESPELELTVSMKFFLRHSLDGSKISNFFFFSKEKGVKWFKRFVMLFNKREKKTGNREKPLREKNERRKERNNFACLLFFLLLLLSEFLFSFHFHVFSIVPKDDKHQVSLLRHWSFLRFENFEHPHTFFH
jgi:hypothetical protein